MNRFRLAMIGSVFMLIMGRFTFAGNTPVQYNIGVTTRDEVEVPTPVTNVVETVVPSATTIQKWREAAGRGDAKAQYNLGVVFGNGNGVATNYVESAKWFLRAAELGDAKAQFNLGNAYITGKGVATNFVEAVKWYRKAAEQGNAKAEFNLGVSFDLGRGVETNHEEAVKWFRKSASRGNAKAQLRLGACYAEGRGVSKNVQMAYGWLRLAQARGVKDIPASLKSLAGSLTPSEQRAAESWVRQWTPSDPSLL